MSKNDVPAFAELYDHELCTDFDKSLLILKPKGYLDEEIYFTKIGYMVILISCEKH